jgi:hypothetical protein
MGATGKSAVGLAVAISTVGCVVVSVGSAVTGADVGAAIEAVASGETLATAGPDVVCSPEERHPPTNANPASKRNPNTTFLNIAILLIRF